MNFSDMEPFDWAEEMERVYVAENAAPIEDVAADAIESYQFAIPSELVRLMIGVKGRTIKELRARSNVQMVIKDQLCQLKGLQAQIDRCLEMVRKRFPLTRYPAFTLSRVD